MTGSIGGLVGRFYVKQYHAFVGHNQLNSTLSTNPATCWKKIKKIGGHENMKHKDAMEYMRRVGITVRCTGMTEADS